MVGGILVSGGLPTGRIAGFAPKRTATLGGTGGTNAAAADAMQDALAALADGGQNSEELALIAAKLAIEDD